MVSFHRRKVDWDIEDINRLAGKKRAGGGPRLGFIVEFDVVVKTVLERRDAEVSRGYLVREYRGQCEVLHGTSMFLPSSKLRHGLVWRRTGLAHHI
jgi:hypothetical protein